MKKYLSLAILLIISCLMSAQPVKKPVTKGNTSQTTQSDINKMMEEVMNQENMTEEEKAEMRKALGQATQMAEEMKKAGITGSANYSTVPDFPIKQTELLQQIPSVQTQQQLNSYFTLLITECKGNIPAEVATEVDKLIIELNGDENQLSVLPIALFLHRSIKAAVYAALRVSQVNSTSPLVQNNSAFVLQQSGYPHKAIPIFKHLQQEYNTAEFNNNLAQCYLSLGDKEEAKKYFRIGLAKNPHSSEMHCSMAFILSEEGNIAEAIQHIIEALKNGYSPITEALAKKHNVKIKLSDIKSKPPEYFNPQKFKPAPPAGSMEDIFIVQAEREAAKDRARDGYEKRERSNDKLSAIAEKDPMLLLQQNIGNTGSTPFSRKAAYMVQLINAERADFVSSKLDISEYNKNNEAYMAEFYARFEEIQTTDFGDDSYGAKKCEAHVNNLNTYLQKSKANFENYERNVLPKIYDYTNQSLYWQSFLLSGEAYTAYFNGEVYDFYDYLNHFDQLQNLAPTPEWIYNTCKNYKEDLGKIRLEEIAEQFSCPINIKIPIGKMASYKINCKGEELEGGELLKFGIEENFKTGEYTLSFGVGGDINTGLINGGVKWVSQVKFASDLSPIDVGWKAEAGLEAQLFIFTVDEKTSVTMGLSTISVDAVHCGEELNLFQYDAKRDSKDAEAAIKPLKI